MPTRDVILPDSTNRFGGMYEVVNKGSNQTQSLLNSLLARTNKMDPVMITILQEMLNELRRLEIEVFPPPDVPKTGSGGDGSADIINPQIFTYNLTPTAVFLEWIPPSSDFFYYELRKGTNWDTAEKILVTSNSQIILEPLKVGTHTYLLKTVGANGVLSAGTSRVDIVIPPIGNFTITSFIVTNSVTLTWTVPASVFKIDYYIVKRNGVEIARQTGTFFAISEQAGGTYTYSVTAVDVAQNTSLPAEITIVTTGITDYIFFSKLFWKKDGIATNVKFSNDILYACIIDETYQQHFTSRNWNSPQEQVNAGYLPWLSPFATSGSYEEIFDFGTIVSNVIVNVSWVHEIYYGNFTFGLETVVSTDGINWSTPAETVSSFFAPSVRYVKVKMHFTAQDDKSLMALTNFAVALNVKRENDGGEGTSLASDSLGTVVYFNKAFVDVEAITVTPVSATSTFATHEFADTPHPTTFKVKIFDNSGVRITRDFRWNARGIV